VFIAGTAAPSRVILSVSRLVVWIHGRDGFELVGAVFPVFGWRRRVYRGNPRVFTGQTLFKDFTTTFLASDMADSLVARVTDATR